MSGERQFEKTFSRRKKAKPSDTELTDTQEEGQQEKGEDKVTAEQVSTSTALEGANVPSSSADSFQGESNGDANCSPAAENGESKSRAKKSIDKQGMKIGVDPRNQQKKKQEKKRPRQGNQRKLAKEKDVPKAKGQKRENGDADTGEKKEEVEEAETDAEQVEGSAGYKFPMNRIVKIFRSEGPDLQINNEAVFLINKAAEKFLEVFCKDSYSCATRSQKNYVSYKNLSTAVSEDKRLDFLADFVPQKVTAEKALAERRPAEKSTG